MRVKDLKSAELYKRCLAVKQFEAYAGLRAVMSNFKDLQEKEIRRNQNIDFFGDEKTEPTPNRIDILLKDNLRSASRGDLSFLTEPEFEKILKTFSEADQRKILKNFESYADFGKTFYHFKSAEQQLQQCFEEKRDGSIQIVGKKIKAFEKDMLHHSDDLKKFSLHFAKHSSTFLKAEHFSLLKDSHAAISLLQPEPGDDTLLKRFASLTPEKFDVNIRGTYNSKSHKKTAQYFAENSDKEPGKFKEGVYKHTVGAHNVRRLTGNKKFNRRVMAAVLTAGIFIGVANPSFSFVKEYNSVTIENAAQLGYESELSESTLSEIKKISETIEALKNSPTPPTKEQLLNLTHSIDSTMSNTLSDLTKKAIEREKPEWSVESATNIYDYNRDENQHYIKVIYQDKNGDPHTMEITEFDHPGIMKDIAHGIVSGDTTLSGTFYSEERLDKNIPTRIEEVFSEGKTFQEISSGTADILNDLEHEYQILAITASKTLKFNKGILSNSVTAENPEHEDDAR